MYKDIGAADVAMARYAAGDAAAFPAVYAAVAPELRRYLTRRVRDRSRVPDLAQETLLHMHRVRESFAPGSRVVPWVLTIARHLLIDAHRPEPRDTPASTDRRISLDGPAVLGGVPVTAEDLVVAKEAAGRLRSALTQLSPPQRAALELIKGEGLSLAEAPVKLGTSVTGVKLRAHRAYRALRAGLAESDAAA